MRIVFLLAAAMMMAAPALAQDFPKSPKAGPPDAMPDALCDAGQSDTGAWAVGRWVAPQTRLEIMADGFVLDRKGTMNDAFGWRDGARIQGRIAKVSPCTLELVTMDGGFTLDAIRTEAGHLFTQARNAKGESLRLTFRRER